MTAVNIKLQLITYIPECYALRAGSANALFALFKTEMHPEGRRKKEEGRRKKEEG
jgi:hypothetical protein